MSILNEFAIQLYSVKDATDKDFIGTLQKLGRNGMGFTGVEFAGYGGLSSAEMKKALDETGLNPIGSHVGLDRLEHALDEEIEFHKAIGAEYIICPMAAMETKSDAIALAEKLTPIAHKITAAGLKFGYHNHAHEFAVCEGEYLLDILFKHLPPTAVMELDIYWSTYAEVDSLAYMEKHRARLELLHVKQIDKDKNNVDLAKGIIDFKDVIPRAQAMGVKHFILEQERHTFTSLASVENCIKYIMSM